MGLTLMKQASLPMQYWSDVFYTSVFLINRLPSKVLHNVSPHELLFLKPPDYDFLRVFGYVLFLLLRPNKRKLDFWFAPYVFLGYCYNQHGYHCCDDSGCVYVSRLVRFHETMFLFPESNGPFIQFVVVKNTTTFPPFFPPFNSSLCTPSDSMSPPLASISPSLL